MKWFAILPDNSISKEFERPNSNFRCSYWIKQINTGKTNTTSYGNTWEIYEYEFYNKKIEKFEIENLGWKIIKINDPIGKNAFRAGVYAHISDPVGVVKEIYANEFEVKGVVASVGSLANYSLFDNWQVFDIKKENNSLKAKLEMAQNENEELTLKIDVFKNTSLFKTLSKKLEPLKNTDSDTSKAKIANLLKLNKLNKKFYNLWLK